MMKTELRMAKKISETSSSPVSHEAIARRAYEIWEGEGRPDGRAIEHWLLAVSELQSAREELTPKGSRSTHDAAPRPRESRFQRT